MCCSLSNTGKQQFTANQSIYQLSDKYRSVLVLWMILLYDVVFGLVNSVIFIVRKRAKIRNRYNQTPHLTQDTNGKVTTSQLDITNESQEVSTIPAGDYKALINRRARKHNKTRQKLQK